MKTNTQALALNPGYLAPCLCIYKATTFGYQMLISNLANESIAFDTVDLTILYIYSALKWEVRVKSSSSDFSVDLVSDRDKFQVQFQVQIFFLHHTKCVELCVSVSIV